MGRKRGAYKKRVREGDWVPEGKAEGHDWDLWRNARAVLDEDEAREREDLRRERMPYFEDRLKTHKLRIEGLSAKRYSNGELLWRREHRARMREQRIGPGCVCEGCGQQYLKLSSWCVRRVGRDPVTGFFVYEARCLSCYRARETARREGLDAYVHFMDEVRGYNMRWLPRGDRLTIRELREAGCGMSRSQLSRIGTGERWASESEMRELSGVMRCVSDKIIQYSVDGPALRNNRLLSGLGIGEFARRCGWLSSRQKNLEKKVSIVDEVTAKILLKNAHFLGWFCIEAQNGD